MLGSGMTNQCVRPSSTSTVSLDPLASFWLYGSDGKTSEGEIMGFTNDVPEEIENSVFMRDADDVVCVHGIGFRLVTDPESGKPVIVFRLAGHASDVGENADDSQNYSKITDLVLLPEEAQEIVNTLEHAIFAASAQMSEAVTGLAILAALFGASGDVEPGITVIDPSQN